MSVQANIESTLQENRVFPPPPEFSATAHVKSMEEYEELYRQAEEDPEAFWGSIAKELHWFKPWDKGLQWDPPFAQWFIGGQINLSYNFLDRHLTTPRPNKAFLIWEGEPGEVLTLTYQQLHDEVCRRSEEHTSELQSL